MESPFAASPTAFLAQSPSGIEDLHQQRATPQAMSMPKLPPAPVKKRKAKKQDPTGCDSAKDLVEGAIASKLTPGATPGSPPDNKPTNTPGSIKRIRLDSASKGKISGGCARRGRPSVSFVDAENASPAANDVGLHPMARPPPTPSSRLQKKHKAASACLSAQRMDKPKEKTEKQERKGKKPRRPAPKRLYGKAAKASKVKALKAKASKKGRGNSESAFCVEDGMC
eukprot:g3258.t1